ncbi:F0F1 ATP synthase subunit A [Glycomyces buryatensis]|uniref:ATP synthase subunit a n=1 Tax=Glycomyces buryatensis TaxID=2570927 RepID=A0A4S8QGP3_9ACTN|nr:F0F1 ATP synthase subunit A [Glycomyces buryatensis]THV42891.1 F0F1 ATP synthase subunit A [Glycomyces buryatensis]
MTDSANVLAAEESHFPPGIHSFDFRDWFTGLSETALAHMFTTITLGVWLTIAILIVFFLWAYRKPQIVPTKKQWLAESAYGFIRNTVSIDLMGKKDGVRFAPYLATLFLFILVMNFWAIVPGIQISPMAHIAFPATLAILSWAIYMWVGVKKHGFIKFMQLTCVPPGAPWFIYPLLIPIEFLQNIILRPVTLALRLFANMFAGHLILLVFILGGFELLNSGNVFIQGMSVLSFAMGIAMTGFELIVILLQAYVFTLLTGMYIQGSLADEH